MIKKLLALTLLCFAGNAQALCLPSGIDDQVIYFIAVDADDFTTRETGLSSFTVHRSRNGGAFVAYTTPTITELDATNGPGIYTLLLDENTTISGGNDQEEMIVHIAHAGMAPVTRAYTLCRPKITYGETLTTLSGVGEAQVVGLNANTVTAAALASDAVDEIADDVAAITCEDQGGGYTLQECMSLILSIMLGEADYDNIDTYTTQDPSGTENRAVIVYGTDPGDRTTITLTPMTP